MARRGLAIVFISHDLAVIRFVADRVLVMHHGEIVESGPARDVVEAPQSAYTANLAAAARAIELP
jgi:peptide/nickel transport system ATP-binding protein